MELSLTGLAEETEHNDALTELAARVGVGIIASSGAHYATAEGFPLATALAAVRARRSLDELNGWLPARGHRLPAQRSGDGRPVRHRYPGAVNRAAAIGRECAFDLELIAPELPPFPVPEGHTEASWLRELTRRGAAGRYGIHAEHPRAATSLPGLGRARLTVARCSARRGW